MATFAFWNVHKNSLNRAISNLAHHYNVDVLILAESKSNAGNLLAELNTTDAPHFHFTFGMCRKIQIYTNFSREFIKPVFESDNLTIRHLQLPARTDILLAAIHFPSKLFFSEASQASECFELARAIRSAEEKLGHTRTILVGDFNMNPFEVGIVAANGLNAVMTKRIASRQTRKLKNREYFFFYNPMWSYFGDGKEDNPGGSYYYERSENVLYYWNLFDQVLIRPSMMPFFPGENLKILSKIGSQSLISENGIPDKVGASDHLPIVFELKL